MLLAVMRQLSGEYFRWRTETYEFVSNPIAIDLLFGSDRERLGLAAGQDWRDLAEFWRTDEDVFASLRNQFLIYPA